MVYNIFSDGGDGRLVSQRRPEPLIKAPQQLQIKSESLPIRILIATIKLILFIYDILSFPIYFIIQRPDQRAWQAQRIRSERVDINTWIKTDQNSNEANHLLPFSGPPRGTSKFWTFSERRRKHRYMGSTISKIFANSVEEFSERSCLGYRAVVTCPMMTLDEEGKHIMKDQSFRSDYTWYTYEQIGRRVQDIASGLYYYSVYPTTRALFLANTCLEWFIASQACFQLAAQLVVAPEIINESSLKSIIEEAEIGIIFVSCDRLRLLSQLFDCVVAESSTSIKVQQIVIIDWQFSVDYNEPAFAELRKSSQLIVKEILSMGQVEEAGVEHPIHLECSKSLNLSSNENETGQLNSMQTDPKWTEEKSSANRTHLSMHSKRRSTVQQQQHHDYRPKSRSPKLSRSDANVHGQPADCKMSPKSTDIGMIVYTHGVLGKIKALKLTHEYLARCNNYLFFDGTSDGICREQDIHCATLSLDNVIEFMNEMSVFSHGGSIGYSCNPNTLFYDGSDLFTRDLSDLQALNPTFLLVRPYILESLRSSIQNYLSLQMSPHMSFILTSVLYDYKKYWARRHFATPIVDRLFCIELRKLFGSHLRYILCNGATDCSETKDFFAFMVNIPVVELYGPDEAIVSLISVDDIWDYKRRKKSREKSSWICLLKRNEDGFEDQEDEEDLFDVQLMPPLVNKNTFKADNSKNLLITSSILCPTLGARIRLEDWEDFRASDQPYPRGRLIIGGDVVCKGYFKRQGFAQDSFYTDSNLITWFRTEDVARVFPNGSFEIISGMSDMIKMDDGQFISLSQIEHILKNSQFVDNVCAVCGDDRKFVIALVVPNLRRLALKSPNEANLKMSIGPEPEPEELIDVEFRREVCNDRLLSEFVNKHLSELIEKAGFKSIPSRFHLVPEIWVPETELVTPSFEPKRNAIQKYYANDIQSIFKMEFSLVAKRLSARSTKTRKSSSPSKLNQVSSYSASRLSY